MTIIRSCAVVGALALVAGAPSEDRITSLPDFGAPPTAAFSGYLDASAAEDGTMLHYWFSASSKGDKQGLDQPVVLWLNGGPGSSSLLGLLQEHGPLLINATGGLVENPYAWTQEANILVIEAPAGVGFSYCAGMLKNESCANTDKGTARANRAAVQNFYKKFPELLPNPFYITGESYAGVYVPTLAREILDHAPEINMAGVAVGDPCTDNTAQKDSMDMLWYGHKHGLVPDADFDLLWNNCTARIPHPLARGKHGAGADNDWKAYNGVQSDECVLAHRRFLMSSSRGFSQEWKLAWLNDLTLYGPSAIVGWDMPGSLNFMQAQYLMRDDVKAALHVQDSPATAWPGPDAGWSYTSQYDACNANVAPGTPSMIDFYRNIAPRMHTTIVFNGDTDPCVSYEGTRTAIERVGFTELPGGSYRPWFYEQKEADLGFLLAKPLLFGPDLSVGRAGGVQFGGHVVNYEHRLSFVTIHGAGHMIPQFRPEAALKLLRALVGQAPLAFSPVFGTGEEILGMSNAEYDIFLDKWTTAAKAAPYV